MVLDSEVKFTAPEFDEALYVSARTGKLNSIKAIFDSERVTPNSKNRVILGAAITNQIDVVKYLLNHAIDINSADSDGCTALHFLGQDSTVDTIRFMIENGADIHAQCRGSETPLTWVIYGKNYEVIEFLESKTQ